ncbi:MAG: HAMP domain-containing sensor histidine kinase, partial [Eubacteriales bacterium]|nr:HAMP domain-containing sensor histidine kinase [Eubacteriales bacterium]
MTFRRRILVAFSTVIVVPMLLFAVSFIALGSYLLREGGELQGYTSIVGSYDDFEAETEKLYREAADHTDRLQDVAYLDEMASEISARNVYLVVRREDGLYYSSNSQMAEADFDQLPAFQEAPRSGAADADTNTDPGNRQETEQDPGSDGARKEKGEKEQGKTETAQGSSAQTLPGPEGSEDSWGITFIRNGKRSLTVRQVDFYFSDGAKGSLFLVTRIMGLISGRFLSGLFVSMLTILVFTAFLLTRWLESSIFTPISAINIAMNNIRDGNFTYTLSTGEEGEIGDLYRNYEDMRLRLKESADEKLEREKQSRELISNISHDLKTPITSIKGYVEGLIDGVANTPEKQAKYIRTIYNKANDMDRLIDELLLYSRFESDRIPYNFHRLNVGDYFGDCVEEIGFDMESRGIELNYTNMVSPQTVIIADPEQMKRVINNIVGNSVKYMDKEKGRIDIRILDEHDSVRIEIEDNGKGIAAKDIPNIFDRFFRTDSSRNSTQGGSGIGLSIVRKIIEDHGGYIWATSREGEGTCMHFVIRKYLEQDPESVDFADSEKQEKPEKNQSRNRNTLKKGTAKKVNRENRTSSKKKAPRKDSHENRKAP